MSVEAMSRGAGHGPAGHTDDDHFEAAPGLPEPLPAGERILWQGAPVWRRLAIDALHLRKLAVYFGALLALQALVTVGNGGTAAQALLAVGGLLPLALMALGLLALFAWLASRATLYTLTDRRIVMRIGIVLTVTFNLPFKRLAGASLLRHPDDTGDIALTLAEGPDRIAWAHLWPHARPWKLRRPEPSLRSIPEAAHVATLLRTALEDYAAEAPRPTGSVTPPTTVTGGTKDRQHGGAGRPALA